jgi:cell division septation protein DedD
MQYERDDRDAPMTSASELAALLLKKNTVIVEPRNLMVTAFSRDTHTPHPAPARPTKNKPAPATPTTSKPGSSALDVQRKGDDR